MVLRTVSSQRPDNGFFIVTTLLLGFVVVLVATTLVARFLLMNFTTAANLSNRVINNITANFSYDSGIEMMRR